MTLHWIITHPNITPEHLGELPLMLDSDDPRPAREQFNSGYGHGGGWDPFPGHTLNKKNELCYPGDPPMALLALTKLRDEVIMLHDCSWVTIVQPDGSKETCRMD
jgi:hypothetical protein